MAVPWSMTCFLASMIWMALSSWVVSCLTVADEIAGSLRTGDIGPYHGNAIGTAWAVFKIRKALNPKSVIKPTTLAKAATEAGSAKLKAKNLSRASVL